MKGIKTKAEKGEREEIEELQEIQAREWELRDGVISLQSSTGNPEGIED